MTGSKAAELAMVAPTRDEQGSSAGFVLTRLVERMIEDDDENEGQVAGCCAADSVQKRMKRVALSVNRTATTLESVAACGCTARACRKSDIGGETDILCEVETVICPPDRHGSTGGQVD